MNKAFIRLLYATCVCCADRYLASLAANRWAEKRYLRIQPDACQPRLRSVTLTQDAYAVGRTLAALGAGVTRVRRRGTRACEPGPETRFETGDVVVMLGEPGALEAAEIRLLTG